MKFGRLIIKLVHTFVIHESFLDVQDLSSFCTEVVLEKFDRAEYSSSTFQCKFVFFKSLLRNSFNCRLFCLYSLVPTNLQYMKS